MSVYKDNMSKISSGRSPRDLAAKIAQSERKPAFRGIRKFSAAAAGAAAAAAITLTVGAVSGWDFDAAVRSLFSVDTAERVSEKFADIEISDYTNEFENVEFNFLGAVSDDIFTTLFLEVTRTDGGAFGSTPRVFGYLEPDGTFEGSDEIAYCDLFGMDSVPGYDFNHSGLGYHCHEPKVMDDGNDSDNKLTYAFIYDTAMLKEYARSNDSVTIKYDFYGIGRKIYSDLDAFIEYCGFWGEDNENVRFEGIKGYMSALVTVPFDNGSAVKSVSPDAPFILRTFDDADNAGQKEFTLKNISVSTASVSFEAGAEICEGDSRYIWFRDDDFITVRMKDGTEFSVGASDLNEMRNIIYGNERWRVKYDCMLGRIIDPEDVEAVTIDGQTFMFE